MVTVKNKWLLLALLLLLIGAIILGWKIGKARGESAAQHNIDALNGQIKEYVIDINGLKKQVSERQQLILTQNQAINAHLIEKSELKKLYFKSVNEVTSLKAQISILKDSLSHTGVITIVEPCDSVGYSFPVIKLPFTFKDGNEDYTLSGGFSEAGIMNIDLNVPIILDIWTGIDKVSKDYKVVVTTPNKVVKITELRSVKLDLPKPKRIGLGAQIGWGVGKNGLTPYVGIGLSYNIIRF
jgi:hypothetical protein